MKNADRLKKGILAETKRANQLKGRCIFIDLDRDADLSLFRPPFCFPVAADT